MVKAEILNIKEKNGLFIIELGNNPFRLAGGGQPCDTGQVQTKYFKGEVIEVLNEKEILTKPVKGKLEKGSINCEINLERRNKLTRMHTAEHILFKAIEKNLEDIELKKIKLEENESSLFINTKKGVSWQKLFEAEKLANKIIQENRKVIIKEVSKSEAEKFKDLRIKVDKVKGETVRIVKVENFDQSACTGTHCQSTKEIGNLLITAFRSAGKNTFEIRFKVDVIEDLFNLSRHTRQTTELLGTELEKVQATIQNLKKDLQKYKKMSREQKISYEEERINNTTFVYNTFENLDKKQLIKQANELLKEKMVIAFINKTEKMPQLILLVSEDLAFDASQILQKIMQEFNGKGGGSKKFAMGSFEEKYINKVFDKIKEALK